MKFFLNFLFESHLSIFIPSLEKIVESAPAKGLDYFLLFSFQIQSHLKLVELSDILINEFL